MSLMWMCLIIVTFVISPRQTEFVSIHYFSVFSDQKSQDNIEAPFKFLAAEFRKIYYERLEVVKTLSA